MVFFFAAHAFFFVYLLCRVVLPLRSPLPAKAGLALIFLVVSQHNLVRRFFGQMSTPEMAGPLIIVEGLCFAALLFFCLLVLADDLAALFRMACRALRAGRKKRERFSPGRRKALLAAAAVIPATLGVREAVIVPDVKRMEERSPKVPKELDGLAIAHIADLHVSPLYDEHWTRDLVKRVNDLAPDLIFITGDVVDGTPGARSRAIAPLGDLRARHGVFGCMGNHEYYGDYRGWQRAFPQLGITMLENRHAIIPVRGRHIAIAGVTDEAAQRFGLPGPDAKAALAGAPPDALRIMLAHRPSGAARNAKAGADLQFSGHTHGGQILGMNRIVARFNEGYIHD